MKSVLDILEVGPTVYLAGEFTAMVPPRTGPADRVQTIRMKVRGAEHGCRHCPPWHKK